MKWCSVSQIWSKPSCSVHSICSSSRWTTSPWVRPGAAWKKKKVPKRIVSPDPGRISRRDDSRSSSVVDALEESEQVAIELAGGLDARAVRGPRDDGELRAGDTLVHGPRHGDVGAAIVVSHQDEGRARDGEDRFAEVAVADGLD